MEQINIIDFVNKMFDKGKFSTFFSEMYWSGGYSNKDSLDYINVLAKELNYQLTDKENSDIESHLYYLYTCDSDKGLS